MKDSQKPTPEGGTGRGALARHEPGPAQPGLDLSLGHIGTSPLTPRYLAFCLACHFTMSAEVYQVAVKLAGPNDDPKCPGCGRRAWQFETWND